MPPYVVYPGVFLLTRFVRVKDSFRPGRHFLLRCPSHSRQEAASESPSASTELNQEALTAGEIGTRADLTRGYYWDHHRVT